MKKILLALMLALFLAVPAFGAGTVVETIQHDIKDTYGHMVVLKYAITADASAGTVPDTTISIRTEDDSDSTQSVLLKNFYVYAIKTVPGTGDDQPDAYTVDLKDADGFSLCDIGARSQTAPEYFDASDTIGIFPPVIGDLTLTVGDLGNSNTATIYIFFTK